MGGRGARGGQRKSGKARRKEAATFQPEDGRNLKATGFGKETCQARVEREWMVAAAAKTVGRDGHTGDGEERVFGCDNQEAEGGQHQDLGGPLPSERLIKTPRDS